MRRKTYFLFTMCLNCSYNLKKKKNLHMIVVSKTLTNLVFSWFSDFSFFLKGKRTQSCIWKADQGEGWSESPGRCPTGAPRPPVAGPAATQQHPESGGTYFRTTKSVYLPHTLNNAKDRLQISGKDKKLFSPILVYLRQWPDFILC